MSQLGKVIAESGLGRLYGNGTGFKKSELVAMMAKYFRKVREMKEPQPDQLEARNWLPEVFAFPAVDPDVKLTPESNEHISEAA
jgi:hypothetical protein